MASKSRRLVRFAGLLILTPVIVILLYALAGIPGALIPRQVAPKASPVDKPGTPSSERKFPIYLIGTALHVDIAIRVEDLPAAFVGKLSETPIPLRNPSLKYLGFGWGSRAFYTTAGSYSDIGLVPTFAAVTGDSAVLRVSTLPDLAPIKGLTKIEVSGSQLDAILAAIEATHKLNADKEWQFLPDYSIGAGDAFFAAKGHFNIFNPCNQWTGRVLSSAGIKTGIWTPTTYGLHLSLRWLNGL